MEIFVLHILKLNIIAAVIILLVKLLAILSLQDNFPQLQQKNLIHEVIPPL